MNPQENKFITLLTPREQRAVDNINVVLNGDGSDPESGPGAWGDCGEVDVPVVLDALSRLSRVPTSASMAGTRLPDAFTNAIGLLEHLGREGVSERLQAVAKIWQERLGQIPGLLARAKERKAEAPVVYHWVDTTQAQAFQDYLDHYHDQQEEALEEASNEHYQEWLETCEPGDEYVVSENDHSLDPYETEFEVVNVDVSEFGQMHQLTFVSTGAALRFGLGWGRLAQSKEMLEFTLSVDKKEAEHLGNFLIREAGHSTHTKDGDVGLVAGSYEVRAEQPRDMFFLGADWQLYRSKGYDFNAKAPIWSEASLRQLLDNTRAHLTEISSSSDGASPDWVHTLEGRAQGAIGVLEFMLEQGEKGPLNLDYYAKLNAKEEGAQPNG